MVVTDYIFKFCDKCLDSASWDSCQDQRKINKNSFLAAIVEDLSQLWKGKDNMDYSGTYITKTLKHLPSTDVKMCIIIL